MDKRILVAVTALAFWLVLPTFSLSGPPPGSPAPPDKDENANAKKAPVEDANSKPDAANIFGLTKLHSFQIEVSPREWERMQPVGGGMPFGPPGGFGGPGAAPAPAAKPGEAPIEKHKGGSFGIEFPFAHAAFTAEGTAYKDIGLRYKGGGSYVMSGGKLKRNLKVELDHYGGNRLFHGLRKLNLNAGAMDPTRMREALAFAVYRDAGVPTPRTAFAEVTLTVPGKYEHELLGLYTVVEQVDKTFLKEHFENSKGLLLKPEVRFGFMRGPLSYSGDDWAPYRAALRPKDEPSAKDAQRVIDFVKLIDKSDDAQFQKEIGSFLDIDEFLRFVAVTALLANMDSFFTGGHNAYIYLNPKTNKFVFIPWDMDLSFGGFFMFGTPEQQAEISLVHPYMGQHKLVDRLLAISEINAKYLQILKDLAASSFTKEKLFKNIEEIEKATQAAAAREVKATAARNEPAVMSFGPTGVMPLGDAPDLRKFVVKRVESAAAQLAGKSKGTMPKMSFGPPGGPPPGGFGPGTVLARPVREAADTNKDGKVSKEELIDAAKRWFTALDPAKKGTIDEKALADALNRMIPRPPGIGGAPPPGGPASGPGQVFASAIFKKADSARNGKITLADFIKAAEALFVASDKNKDNLLDEGEISSAINALLPPPPGFGPGAPPGPRPPDRPKP